MYNGGGLVKELRLYFCYQNLLLWILRVSTTIDNIFYTFIRIS